ncbi:hypothetical protein H6A18_11030 [Collinsella tanakaei]|uniref:hypothetical protein n=1 Tax=Collinsella tanakaei TaxID=626935 RepID=UPI00195C866D|nr:hypothetical protein [Collinsella tanakaei]MBM6757031.1 hypothetical protein [Collinsella tanakaei]
MEETSEIEAIGEYDSAVERNEADSYAFDESDINADVISKESRRRDSISRSRALEANAERLEEENSLRKDLASSALGLVKKQVIFCDVVIAIYFIWSMCTGSAIPPEVIIGWLTSCLVEIIGILWVIARSLFPFRDFHRDREGEKQ